MPNITINRRHMRTQQLLGHVMHYIAPYLAKDQMRNVANVLEELFFVSGVQIITEAERAEAGLESRDHNGWTTQELRIFEAKMVEAMLRPPSPLLVKCPKCDYHEPVKTMRLKAHGLGPNDPIGTIAGDEQIETSEK